MLLNEKLLCATQRSLLYSKTNIGLDMNIVYLGHVIACLAGTVSTTSRRSLLFVCCAYCPHVACEAVVVFLCHQTVTRVDLLSDALRVQMCENRSG